ncbi:PREDICTED: uncharacterized protein LOC109343150 [Lupinus angustifolius]|uniref:uncharacterized protein LOC109343150 n=1 Tax=Lupinus angustifolius TaxID=3871 RepID=UPI00092EF71A|nr:PREDICTED: uncharacterized protein LOC109343150 [Lupinus angustifolius]XP_019436871.1 PREDICTED: uncharacterized protein LOC109343150 [Lupinus angustifolius]
MALLPSKLLLLLAFLLLCFITTTPRARSLRDTSGNGVEKGQSSVKVFKPNNREGAQSSSDEVDTMDYTPAKRNPPIHN